MLVRSVTTREVEWDEEQQAWMLALAIYRRDQCGKCGSYLPESTAFDMDDAYEAVGPFLCGGCQAVGRAYDTHIKETELSPTYDPSRYIVHRKE